MVEAEPAEAKGGVWTARRLALPLFVALAVVLVFTGRSPGLADPDWWWHLETGRLILDTRALPQGDPFSWTHEGAPWVLQSWLFQVWLAALWQVAGDAGVAVATAILLALGWWIAFATADGMVHRPALTLLVALVLGAGIAAAGSPRPQLISLILFALLLAAVFRAKYAGRHGALLSIPVLMILWVNVHGAFVLGVAAIGAFAALEFIILMLGRRDGRQLRLCVWLTITALATVAATGLNPWGYAHWAYPLYVSGLELTGDIAEWRSIMESPWRGPWYAAGGVLFFVLLANAPNRPDLTEMLFPAALFLAGLIHARHAPFAGMAMLVFAAPALWRDRAGPGPLRGVFRAAGWLVAVAGLATPVLLVKGPYLRAIDGVVPSDVAAYLDQARPGRRMFNDYAIGGYLIHRLPDQPVFIDGRADLYGDAFYRGYAETVAGEVPLALHFDAWGIDHAILHPRHALARQLIARGWQVVFRGRSHIVLVPRRT